MPMTRAIRLKNLKQIPGVGKNIAEDLLDLGFRAPEGLKNENPEHLYERLCALRGRPIDRCMLYVLRCAVYFASHTRHDPEKLKWWKWKDV